MPNDPGFASTPGSQDYLKQIGMPAAWAIDHDASSQVIAIVDSGVDATNSDLAGVVLPGKDFVGTGDGRTDPYGSGTNEAGVAAAIDNNGIGIAGVAWGAKILPVRVFDANGYATSANIAAGIRWAADNGATVISLSLWGGNDDAGIRAAVEYAIADGIPVVAAAGEGYHTTLPYPAADPGVISVNGDAPNQHIANFSPLAPGVDLSAPSVNIRGLSSAQAPVQVNQGNGTTMGDGAGLSAPMVSGVVALMRAHMPWLTPAQINQRMRESAVDLGPVGVDPYHGFGQVDAAAALSGTVSSGSPPAPILDTNDPNNVPALATTIGTSAAGTINIEGAVHWYRYISTGGRLAVTVDPDNDGQDGLTIDPAVDVYNAQLQQIGHENFNGIGQAETVHVIVASGPIYIRVQNADGSVDPNPYRITIAADPENGNYFGDPHSYDLGAVGVAVSTGDVTGDGLPDVVVATTSYDGGNTGLDNSLWVFPQAPDGSLGTPSVYPTDLYYASEVPPTSIAIGDFTGNGRNDVALSTSHGIDIYMQGANGQLVDEGLMPNSPSNVSLAAGPVLGDGKDDLAVEGNGIWLMTWGASGWTTQTVTSAKPGGARQIKIGEVDGDSIPDLVTVDYADNNAQLDGVYVYSHPAASSSWAPTFHSLPSPPSGNGFVVADLNADGRQDVAVSAGCTCNDELLQDASGSLVAQAVTQQIDGVGFSAGDIDGDGANDLATCCVNSVLEPADTFPFSRWGNTKLGGPADMTTDPEAFTIADINNDGKADAIRADYDDGLVIEYSDAGMKTTRALDQPWVDNVNPVDGTALASTGAATVTFGRPVQAGSVTGAAVSLINTVTGIAVPTTVTYDSATNRATIQPARTLAAGTPYRIVVHGVIGADGSTMGGVDGAATGYEGFESTFTATAPPGSFVSLTPQRLLDTRTGTGAWKAPVIGGGVARVQVLGQGGVPTSGVSAVVLNVTATRPVGAGYVSAYADGATRPGSSNLNYVAGQTVPNLIMVPVGADGMVDLYSSTKADLLADVEGYVVAGAPTAGGFASLAPARVLDTRSGTGAVKAPVAAHSAIHVQILGRAGVPSFGVSAVVMNLTVSHPVTGGYVTAYADGSPQPGASTVNFAGGQAVPNLVIAPVGPDGKISVYTSAKTDLIADVQGYVLAGSGGSGSFASLAPSRLLDTRIGLGAPRAPVASGGVVQLLVRGRGGMPSTRISAVVLNVTVTRPVVGGYITAYADGDSRPAASNLNYLAGQTVSNLVIVPVGPDGVVDLYALKQTDLVADVEGYIQ